MDTVEKLPNGWTLRQRDTLFKLGQDSVLLSAFAHVREKGHTLDLGCGCGALTVLLAARHPDLKILGLELLPEAGDLFLQNIEDNGLTDRVCLQRGDLRNEKTLLRAGAMDDVVCNPPYFVMGHGKTPAEKTLRTARHASTYTAAGASIEEICRAAAFALKQGGRCHFVFRPERLRALFHACTAVRLEPKHLQFVHQNITKMPSVFLLTAQKDASEGLQVSPPLLLQNTDGSYSDAYLKIYKL